MDATAAAVAASYAAPRCWDALPVEVLGFVLVAGELTFSDLVHLFNVWRWARQKARNSEIGSLYARLLDKLMQRVVWQRAADRLSETERRWHGVYLGAVALPHPIECRWTGLMLSWLKVPPLPYHWDINESLLLAMQRLSAEPAAQAARWLLVGEGTSRFACRTRAASVLAMKCAVDRGHCEAMRVFLYHNEKGAMPFLRGYFLRTFLLPAVWTGNAGMVEVLLTNPERGDSADFMDGSERFVRTTALAVAVRRNFPTIVRVLLTRGPPTACARPSQQVEVTGGQVPAFRSIPFMDAIAQNRPELVRLMMTAGPPKTRARAAFDTSSALQLAVSYNHVETARVLLTEGPIAARARATDRGIRGALVAAARCGHEEMVRLLLTTGPEETRARGDTSSSHALLMASTYNHPGTARILRTEGCLETRARANAGKSHALTVALSRGYVEVIRVLLCDGPPETRALATDISDERISAALRAGHLAAVRALCFEGPVATRHRWLADDVAS